MEATKKRRMTTKQKARAAADIRESAMDNETEMLDMMDKIGHMFGLTPEFIHRKRKELATKRKLHERLCAKEGV